MPTSAIEERVTALEQELAEIKKQLSHSNPPSPVPWWEQRFGAFADSPEYEEATRLGRKYRESQRPKFGQDDT